jgi:hypothetical protein
MGVVVACAIAHVAFVGGLILHYLAFKDSLDSQRLHQFGPMDSDEAHHFPLSQILAAVRVHLDHVKFLFAPLQKLALYKRKEARMTGPLLACAVWLEEQLRRELELARTVEYAGGLRRLSEGSCGEGDDARICCTRQRSGKGVGKVRYTEDLALVDGVEDLHEDLELDRFMDREVTREPCIDVTDSAVDKGIAP